MEVDISVLTPVLNEEEHILKAADSMLDQRFAGTVEFIFIDGGSTDRTLDILLELQREDPRIRILHNPQRSTPVALNIGLHAARGEYIARMDAHTMYPDDYLARAVERLRKGDVAHVSGPQLPHGDGKWSRRVAMALMTPLGRGGARFRSESQDEIDVDSGFTGVWTREILTEHGGWDEDWHNDQDSELAARIRESGGRIVCLPEMAAQYIPRNSLRALARQYWRYGYYRAKTSNAHPRSMRRSHVLAPGLVVTLATMLAPLGALRWVGRGAVALWAAAVVAFAVGSAYRDTSAELGVTPIDLAALPAVFAAMHVAWGLGFLAGCVRFGPPIRAVGNLLGRRSA
jgi:glycosyltransferase involved in cell wall biosynthesis